jgi:MFS family permease
MAAGSIAVALGALMLIALQAHTNLIVLIVAAALFGIGFGLVNPPITNTAVAGMPRSQAGVAAGIATTSRQVGTTLGVALAGSIVNASLGDQITTGLPHATHAFWWITIALSVTSAVLGVGTTGVRARRTAEAAARLIAESDDDDRVSLAQSGAFASNPLMTQDSSARPYQSLASRTPGSAKK